MCSLREEGRQSRQRPDACAGCSEWERAVQLEELLEERGSLQLMLEIDLESSEAVAVRSPPDSAVVMVWEVVVVEMVV